MPEKHRRSEVVKLTSSASREADTEVSPCGSFKANTLWSSLPDQSTTTTATTNNNNSNNNNSTSKSARPGSKGGRTGGRAGQISQITEGVFLSGARAVRPARIAEMGLTCVVNATTELPNAPLEGVRVVAVRVPDEPSADLASHLVDAADLIHEEVSRGGRVLVHCVAGVSRSPALVLAYLVRHCGMALREAFLHVRAARPSARPNSGFFSQLIEFEREERGCGSVTLCLTPGGRVPDVCLEEAAAMQDKRCVAAMSDRRGLQRVYA